MIKPLGERVVVRREKEETKTATGIILDNGKTVPFDVKVGDKVFLSSYAGDNEVTYEGEDLTIIDQNQILAVIE